jgi:uncharacterized metal-binding protein
MSKISSKISKSASIAKYQHLKKVIANFLKLYLELFKSCCEFGVLLKAALALDPRCTRNIGMFSARLNAAGFCMSAFFGFLLAVAVT